MTYLIEKMKNERKYLSKWFYLPEAGVLGGVMIEGVSPPHVDMVSKEDATVVTIVLLFSSGDLYMDALSEESLVCCSCTALIYSSWSCCLLRAT